MTPALQDPLQAAHDLMRRLPPSRTADSINDVLDIAGDEAEVPAPLSARLEGDPWLCSGLKPSLGPWTHRSAWQRILKTGPRTLCATITVMATLTGVRLSVCFLRLTRSFASQVSMV